MSETSGADERQRLAWALAALLFAASVLNYVDRAVLGVLMPQVRGDLRLSNTEYGLAVNSFLTMYAVFYVLGGRLSDWFGYRRTVLWSITVWSVANMLHGAVQGLRGLCVFRAMLGVGEGGFYPAAIQCATVWFPPQKRAKVIGLLLAGLSVGTLLTPPVAAWILIHYGWRAAFVATGAAGLLLLPPWLWLHRGRRAKPTEPGVPVEPAGEASIRLADVFRSSKYWCILAARSMSDAAWYFYLFWMPGYFQDVRAFDPAMVGRFLWIPYFSAGAGAIVGAWISSRLMRAGASSDRARKTVLFPSAALASLGTFVFLAPDPPAALALASLALFAHQSWSSNLHTAITEISPRAHVSVLYGVTGAAGTLAGAVAQPLIGRVVDTQGYGPAFAAAGLAYVAAIVLLGRAGKIEPIQP